MHFFGEYLFKLAKNLKNVISRIVSREQEVQLSNREANTGTGGQYPRK